MEQHWLIRNNNARLLVIALGWGADPRVVRHIVPSGYDILCLYDYRSATPIPEDIFRTYRYRVLAAWSFGVRMAETLFAPGTFDTAIALCGTPLPVHDTMGIPVRAFEATLRGLASAGDEKFNRRTYGEHYHTLFGPEQPAQRSLETRIEELETLYKIARTPYTPSIKWSQAIVGGRDMIFPPANQLNYWTEKAILVKDLPHYPFADPTLIYRYLGNE